ncbi:hypothetical protein ACFCV8_36040 [Streptomyces sp. NPDC056347]|uniref:hypothetical protein n=1 Tax=unclassified Streptomyces TaxID=2593676 RepID=UPI0035E012E1
MAISISLVVLLLILAVVFLRNGLKLSHALVCALLGFFLAGSSMGPTIQDSLAATADVVGSLRP